MYGYIYKTTNLINGKIYVGQHKAHNFEPNKYIGSGTLLKKAIDKYGVDKFKCEILEWCDSKEELGQREIFWINHYKSIAVKHGYNLTAGGSGGDTTIRMSEEALKNRKNKLSEKIRGTVLVRNLKTNEGIRVNKSQLEEYRLRGYVTEAPKITYTEGVRNKMSTAAKIRCKNNPPIGTLNRIRVCLPDSTNNKFIKKDELETYLSNGYILYGDIHNKTKLYRREHTKEKYQQKRLNKVLLKKDNKNILVPCEEACTYLNDGYTYANNCLGKKHSKDTIEKMRHKHKKMISTENISLSHSKWIYVFDGIEFYGITKLYNYLIASGYKIKRSSILNLIQGKPTTLILYPELSGKIERREKD